MGEALRLRNLSRRPLVASGVTVPPRGRAELVLPTSIDLGDGAEVRLFLKVSVQEGAPLAPKGLAQ
jgi:hypothetical protein